MKKITLLFSLIFCLGISVIYAQDRTISGTVTDKNGTVPGVNIQVKGTSVGTITDFDGKYQIKVPEDATTLVFSFVGYQQKEVPIGDKNTINVQLQLEEQTLEGVVVTALGIKREKKALGYAVQDVKGDELSKTQHPNMVNTLSGKVAGVQVTNSSGAIGASSVIKIRGNKSLTSNSQPLFVIDGTPILNSTNNARSTSNANVDFGNAAMDIDPANIESISILKGGAAAALYGSRGANGVVLITTKSGKSQKGIGVEFSSSISINKAFFFPDYQDDYGQGFSGSEYIYNELMAKYEELGRETMPYEEYINERSFKFNLEGNGVNMKADESWGGRLDAGLLVDQMHGEQQPWVSNPDNIKDFFNTGVNISNNIALSAGNDMANGRLTFAHMDAKGIIPNTDQTRYNLGINTSFKLGKRLTASVNANYVELSNDNLPSLGRNFRNPFYALNGWFGRQVDLGYVEDHYDEIVDNNGTLMAFNWMMGYDNQHPSVYWVLFKNTMSRKRKRLYGNASLTFEIADGINLMARAGTDTYNEKRNYIYHKYSRKDWTLFDDPVNGAFQDRVKLVHETNLDLLLSIDKNLGDNLTFAGTLGGNLRSEESVTSTITANELVVPNFFATSNIQDAPEADYYIWRRETSSVFGSANFGYRNYLFLDFSLRGDWSSTLPPDSWNYWYPSASLGFVFTDAFGIGGNILQYGKARVSYAIVGNGASPYNLESTISSVDNPFNEVKMYYLSTSLASPTLKPEKTHSFETGLELKFLSNRAGIDFTYYQTSSFNQLMAVEVPYSCGFNYWYKNAGNIENKGVELQLYGSPVKSSAGFNWDITVNWWKNNNEVVELDDGINEFSLGTSYVNADVYLRAIPGYPLGAITGYQMARNDNGDVIVSESGIPVAEDSLTIIGNVQPDWEGGISNSFSYKNLSLSVLLKFRKGGDVVSVTKSVGQKTGILAVTAEDGIRENGMLIEGVYEEGAEDDEGNDISGQPNTTIVAPQTYWGYNSRNYSELAVFDGGYAKISELSLEYRIPASITKKVRLQRASISIFARNVAVLWLHESNDAHIDPEVSAGASLSGTGLEESQIPAPRTLGMKLDVKF